MSKEVEHLEKLLEEARNDRREAAEDEDWREVAAAQEKVEVLLRAVADERSLHPPKPPA